MDGLLMSLPKRCLPVLMLNLNDRLGRPRTEESSDPIGDVGAGNEVDSATRFRETFRFFNGSQFKNSDNSKFHSFNLQTL